MEFFVQKTEMERLCGISYKLNVMGITIAGTTYMYGGNMSVIYNKSWPKFHLKRKLNYICYHDMHEAVAMGKVLTTHFKSENN